MDLLWFKKVILKLIAKSKNKICMLINIRGTKQKLGKIVLSTRNIGWDSESVIIRSAMKNILMSQQKTAKTTYIYTEYIHFTCDSAAPESNQKTTSVLQCSPGGLRGGLTPEKFSVYVASFSPQSALMWYGMHSISMVAAGGWALGTTQTTVLTKNNPSNAEKIQHSYMEELFKLDASI